MQIQNDPKRRDQRSEKVEGGSSSKNSGGTEKSQGFQQIISASADQIRESLDQLMLELDGCADELMRHPGESQLTQYTQAVRNFLRKAQGEAFSVDRHFDRHNRLYMVVREVDANLAALTDQILNSQGKALETAARIQEIRGILLDFYI